MQGPIAQALALACIGNAFLRGKDVSGFWPDATVFRFSKSCDFRRVDGERDELIAPDPAAWFETLRASRGLRLHAEARPRGPQQTIPAPDRMLAGLVGGGPAWIIEAVGAEGSTRWQGHDRLGDRDDRQRKIWLHTYLMADEPQASPRAPRPLREATRDLDKALVEIEAFAKEVAPAWAENFGTARAVLNADKPDTGFHTDIADYADFTKQQRQVLGAVSASWVFGGMGSWNDIAPEQARAADYERISEQLYRTLIAAISALANSTFSA